MFHLITRKKMMCTAVAGALVLLAGPGYAQDGASGTPPPSAATTPAASAKTPASTLTSADQIQEVMVTATRTTTSLLKTPVAMTALSQEELTKKGVTNVKGLSGEIPNLQLGGAVDGSSGVQISIRGVSNSDFTEIGNPAVGLHVASIYSPRPQGALALLFDLDRLEILRGPQGTLFGRNSTGGSINIIPAKPEIGKEYGSSELELGNYNHRQLTLIQNIPINDKMALRVTAMKQKQDGWINQSQDFYDVNMPDKGFPADGIPDVDQRHNTKVGKSKYYTNKDEWAGRISGLWNITNDLKWQVSFENFQNNDAGDIAMKDCAQAAGTPYACTGGKYDVSINTPGITNMSIRSWRSNLAWKLNEHTDIEYNYGHAIQRRFQQQDGDSGYQPLESQVTANPITGGGVWPVSDSATYTMASKFASDVHEVQLRQHWDQIRYVAGLFYMKEKNTLDYGQDFMASDVDGYPYSNFYHQPDRESKSTAAFAQTDWQFKPKWNLTVGARLSRDERSDKDGQFWESYGTDYFNGLINPGGPGTPGYTGVNSSMLLPGMGAYYGSSAFPAGSVNSSHSASWSKVTGRLGLTYQADPNTMFYGSLSTGYKAGGFNDMVNLCGTGGYNCATGPAGPQYSFLPYKPETLTNWEIGYKGKLLDGRLTLSATLFYSKYKDMQVAGQHTIGTTDQVCDAAHPACNAVISYYSTQNVAEANIKGLEIEGEYRPWHGARVSYSGSLLSAKVADYPTYSDDIGCDARAAQGVTACPPYYNGTNVALAQLRPLNIKGNHLPYAPPRTINIGFSQDFDFDSGYTVTPWVQGRWQDKEYFSLRNLDASHLSDAQHAYAQVDASLRLTAPNEKWHAELYVRNLGDVRAKTWSGTGGPQQTFTIASYNDPRMYGVRLGTQW